MEKLIRLGWLRRGAFWAALALVLATVFSWGEPAEAARSRRTQYTSGGQSRVVRRGVRNRRLRYRRNRTGRARRGGRWIQVDLSRQRLIAWEGGRRVYSIPISSGKRRTPTPTGTYYVQTKLRSTRMRSARHGYDVRNVPYTMYYSGGYAIHGAYWHNRFGSRASHGCVNLPVAQARRLYSWAPAGTRIVVHH